jgi:predicted GNAT family N-acyltransferase
VRDQKYFSRLTKLYHTALVPLEQGRKENVVMKTDVSIVTNANDFQACLAVRAAAFLARGEPYSEEYDGNDLVCATHLLARQAEEPIGTMRIRILSGVAVWERLAVTPAAYRGVGVLNSLANTAMSYTQFKCCHEIIGGVSDLRLIRFWERRGFKKNNKTPVKYNETEYIQMGMKLTPNSPIVDLNKASLRESNWFQDTLEKGTALSTIPIRSCA